MNYYDIMVKMTHSTDLFQTGHSLLKIGVMLVNLVKMYYYDYPY